MPSPEKPATPSPAASLAGNLLLGVLSVVATIVALIAMTTGAVLIPARDGYRWLSWGQDRGVFLATLAFWAFMGVGSAWSLALRLKGPPPG